MRFYFIIPALVMLMSCYREVEILPVARDQFELSVTKEMQDLIHESDTSITIIDPNLQLSYNGQMLDLKKLKTRGMNSLNYRRKSYSVNLDKPVLVMGREGADSRVLTEFKLIALAMDYTYIESRVSFGLMEVAGLMPLHYKFVELILNGQTEGTYFLVENPEEFFKDQDSEFILRRGYRSWIADAAYEPGQYGIPETVYLERYREIYQLITQYSGEVLYNELSNRLNLELYFRKMAMDYLLMNGDYTDEVFLYSQVVDGEIQFRPIPWDYDDVFASKPHEVGTNWSTGRVFGERYYATYQDVLDELGGKLIFSIEDDLDYIISRDSYLYARYEETMIRLMEELDEQCIADVFEELKQELLPFYYDEDIVAQSMFDEDPTSRELWLSNMEAKEILLKDRLSTMKNALQVQ